jgi:hypothetical protein
VPTSGPYPYYSERIRQTVAKCGYHFAGIPSTFLFDEYCKTVKNIFMQDFRKNAALLVKFKDSGKNARFHQAWRSCCEVFCNGV